MYRRHGSKFVIAYLKASQLALQKAIAGTPVSSLKELGGNLPFRRLSSGGLPSFIPVTDRRLIAAHSSPVIRWWLTLFGVYRVISIPGVLKLGTITDALTSTQSRVDEVANQVTKLVNPTNFDLRKFVKSGPGIQWLESASATNKVAWMGFITDVIALHRLGLSDPIIRFMKYFQWYDLKGHFEFILKSFNKESIREKIPAFSYEAGLPLEAVSVGKLVIKHEPAGKERVFAMPDVWTQSIMKPVHDTLFDHLRRLPNDGTFDQNASVKRCHQKAAITKKSFGYDLTAATDRVPLTLQSSIIEVLFPGLGLLWAQILVDREYRLTIKHGKGKAATEEVKKMRYAVGQPMGAYSSWAMLAVTHHHIAQLAAVKAFEKAGKDRSGDFWIGNSPTDASVFGINGYWYTGYEVLGDDIVFFEEDVAKEYLLLMEELGCGINLAKSVIATNPTFEFAKVTGHYGRHVGAVSWAMLMSQPTLMGRANIAYSYLTKGIITERINPFIERMARASKYTEGSSNPMYIALASMLAKSGRLPLLELLYAIAQKTDGWFDLYDSLMKKANVQAIAQSLPSYFKEGVEPMPLRVGQFRPGWETEELYLAKTYSKVVKGFLGMIYNPTVKSVSANPKRDAHKLTMSILSAPSMLLMIGDHEGLDFNLKSMTDRGVFNTFRGNFRIWTPKEEFINTIYIWVFKHFYAKLTALHQRVQDHILNLDELELSKLVELIDIIERYREVCAMHERGLGKLKGDTKPKDLEDSPLAILKTLLGKEKPNYSPMATKVWIRPDTSMGKPQEAMVHPPRPKNKSQATSLFFDI